MSSKNARVRCSPASVVLCFLFPCSLFLCFLSACASKDTTASPAFFSSNATGKPVIGVSAIDARWSNYGQYLQKLANTVQTRWEDLNEQNKADPLAGTKIAVKFRLNSEGQTEIIYAEGNGDTQTTNLCKNAITDSAPHDKWTDNMREILGASQEMTLTFDYGKPSKMKAALNYRGTKTPGWAGFYKYGELDQMPQPKGIRATPAYPASMKRQGAAGQITLAFIVDTKGNVSEIQVMKTTSREFVQPAIDAVSKWKFRPGIKEGRPVNCLVQIPISFDLTADK